MSSRYVSCALLINPKRTFGKLSKAPTLAMVDSSENRFTSSTLALFDASSKAIINCLNAKDT